MQTHSNSSSTPIVAAHRPIMAAAMNGMRSTCPSCGTGRLFSGGLRVNDHCSQCSEALYHHRADDLPAYLNIFIVGHVVVAVMMIAMGWNLMGIWPLTALTVAIAIVCAVALMRPIKGAVVGVQWALRMHGFGGHDD